MIPKKPEEQPVPPKSNKKITFQSPRGMNDILPEDAVYYDFLYDIAKNLFYAYDYQAIYTPMAENVELYERGTGIATDIVEKEMFRIEKRGDEDLVLRPEFTPGIMRSYIEHGMASKPQPVKLYTIGPVFRYDRPQAGRYRQFNQINVEVVGSSKPVIDAEIIDLAWNIIEKAGIKDIILQINSIGSVESRQEYIIALKEYMKPHERKISEEDRQRLKQNPLRILDSKNEKTQRLLMQAPQIIDFLNDEDSAHFKAVMEYLDEVDIPYNINPKLVRGLDYYSRTVFEIWPMETGNSLAQSSLGGGGRYDGLIEILGGNPTPAVGMALGVERVILAMKEQGVTPKNIKKPRVYVAQLGDLARRKALNLYKKLFAAGLPVTQNFGRESIKSQLKQADKLGVEMALILGQKEAVEGMIIMRDMASGMQEIVNQKAIIGEVRKRLEAYDAEKKAEEVDLDEGIDMEAIKEAVKKKKSKKK